MKIEIRKSKFYVNLPVELYKKIEMISDKHEDIHLAMLGLLLHFILSNKYKDKNLENGSEWVALNAKILNSYNFNGYKTKRHLEVLLDYEVIERVNHYVNKRRKKSRSRLYKINPAYFEPSNSSVEGKIINDKFYSFTSPKTVQKVTKWLTKRRVKADYKCEHLTKWLMDSGFEIQTDKAIKYVNDKYSLEKDIYKRDKRIQAINSFSSYQTSYSRKGKDDRLHSVFGYLPTDLKQFIRYRGQRLKEVDMKSSQPFIFSFILEIIKHEYNSQIEKFGKITHKRFSNRLCKRFKELTNEYIEEEYRLNIEGICDSVTIMLQKHSGKGDFTQINEFISLIKSGELYEFIGDELIKRGSIVLEDEEYCVNLYNKESNTIELFKFDTLRKCAKKITINALYGSVRNAKVEALKHFAYTFPEVSKFLDAMKMKEKSDLPILMQRIEAKFMLDYCSKKISKKHPEILLITRHDSLVTREADFEILKHEFKILLLEYFDGEVKFGVESWA
ncbi:hypothetical protein LB456_12090 [Psychroflexus sp. CAK57W]|uniref:hypothetical protein n=1 Tax=Psychroflexus curvus TaxID=2873595 RepID=UPI001CCB2EFF|nr:hypothetical protein [Psychroflexus curvus]MBZ9788200.1 hypothetical protein [Psychroflexus curvus]